MKKIILLFALIFISCKNEVKQEPIVTKVETPTIKVEKPLSDDELKVLIQKEYASMNKDLGGFTPFPSASKTALEALLIKAKNTVYEKKILKSIDSLDTVMNKNIEANLASERKDYETTLKNSFLDNNLNIKVKVSGKDNTIITLTYPLFNEIWFRKFETQGHFDKLASKGFKKIILTDNYNYGQSMTYK